MSDNPGPNDPAKKIIIDEDWKSQVEAERAKPAEPPKTRRSSVPPASFGTHVSMLATQALVFLGAIPNPVTNQAEVDLDQARHFIDTIQMLEEKTKGNLAPEESRHVADVLHDLRMAFVAVQTGTTSAGEAS